MATWNHPKLGRFEYKHTGWVATVDAPALDAFKCDEEVDDDYDDGEDDEDDEDEHHDDEHHDDEHQDDEHEDEGDDDGLPGGKYELEFEADDKKDLPTEEAVAVALRVIANNAALVPKITKALWEDFNGRGPDSGMWWHGDMDQVAQGMDRPPPRGPDDLLALMVATGIVIHKEVDGYERPVAEITFGAVFEEEHGVGILTDGRDVLGTGYIADVTPYGYDSDSEDEDEDEDE
jgi:hypothetical protein